MSSVLRECGCCGLAKPYDPSAKSQSKASGFYRTRCWDCIKEDSKARHAAYRATPDGREKRIAAVVAWQKANPEYRRAANQRRKQAPAWDKNAIVRIQARAEREGKQSDHVFPIRAVDPKTGLRASGLNRSWNMQVLTKTENAAKGNRVDFEQEERRLMDQWWGG